MAMTPSPTWQWLRFCLASAVAVFLLVGITLHLFDGWQEMIVAGLAHSGVTGFFVFAWLYNVLVVPFPFDPFMLMARGLAHGGALWPWWLAATLGMGCAAATSYALARWVLEPRIHPWLARQRGYNRTVRALRRYGVWAVAFSALTPIPFSMVCWMAGFLRLNMAAVVGLAFLTRGLRHALVLWLFG